MSNGHFIRSVPCQAVYCSTAPRGTLQSMGIQSRILASWLWHETLLVDRVPEHYEVRHLGTPFPSRWTTNRRHGMFFVDTTRLYMLLRPKDSKDSHPWPPRPPLRPKLTTYSLSQGLNEKTVITIALLILHDVEDPMNIFFLLS